MVDSTGESVVVVDSHVHVFPPGLVSQRERLCGSDRWFGELYTNSAARLASIEELIESMDEAGIDISVLCGFPFSDLALCREHNDYMAESSRHYPQRIAWLASIQPLDPQAPDEIERTLELGAAGVGELNADGQGFDLADPESLRGLAETCIQYRCPVMFHVSEPVGHTYPGKGTATPDKLLRLLETFPELHVIAAHWGGGLPFYELMPEVGRATRNVVYDSAATTYLYGFAIFEAVIGLIGAERVMFASDYPVLRQDRLKRRLDQLDLPTDTRALIMGKNAMRVFGIDTQRDDETTN